MVDDASAVSRLILRERQGRDRGRWEQMRECYLPDSRVRVSWFTGTGPEFVDRSIAMAERGLRALHRMSPPVVRVAGDRAFAEAPAAIEVRTETGGIVVDLVSCLRLLVRAERVAEGWRIRRLDGVYGRDTLQPAIPGTALAVDPADFAGFRPTYRCRSWRLADLGYPVDQDLPGDDRPDEVERMYRDADAWPAAG